MSQKMKMTYGKLLNEFNPALAELASLKIKEMSVLVRIAKARRSVKELISDYQEVRSKIAENDCEKDENGKPVIHSPNGQPMYKYSSTEKSNEVLTKIMELDRSEVEFEVTQISSSDLNGVDGCSANILEMLGDFIILE